MVGCWRDCDCGSNVLLYLVVSVKMLDSRYGHVFTLPLIFGFLKDDFLLSALIFPFALMYIKAKD